MWSFRITAEMRSVFLFGVMYGDNFFLNFFVDIDVVLIKFLKKSDLSL